MKTRITDLDRAVIKLRDLLKIRDIYNEGWKPNYRDSMGYSIIVEDDNLLIDKFLGDGSEFIFKYRNLAKLFLYNYHEDIKFIFKHLYMWNYADNCHLNNIKY